MNPRKPNTRQAMQQLLVEIREHLPLYAPEASFCQKQCVGCSKKLIEFIRHEYEYWDMALSQGDTPSLGDINKLARSARKIGVVLEKNGLIAAPHRTNPIMRQ